MKYENFEKLLTGANSGLPMNRKERFFTGTVLPALLFHNGVDNLITFLDMIGIPNELFNCIKKHKFLFYTEYNLKQSASNYSIGTQIDTETNDTPDIVIEVPHETKRYFIFIEAKMFDNVYSSDLKDQIEAQFVNVIKPINNKYQEADCRHFTLIPRKYSHIDQKYFNNTIIINWEMFFDIRFNLGECHFLNYLLFAINNFDMMRTKKKSYDKKRGRDIKSDFDTGSTYYIGKKNAIESIKEDDTKNDAWREKKYCISREIPKGGRKSSWITIKQFLGIVEGVT